MALFFRMSLGNGIRRTAGEFVDRSVYLGVAQTFEGLHLAVDLLQNQARELRGVLGEVSARIGGPFFSVLSIKVDPYYSIPIAPSRSRSRQVVLRVASGG